MCVCHRKFVVQYFYVRIKYFWRSCTTYKPVKFSLLLLYRWWCHFDDDNYVNIDLLLDILSKYDWRKDFYLGKPSVIDESEVTIWFYIFVVNKLSGFKFTLQVRPFFLYSNIYFSCTWVYFNGFRYLSAPFYGNLYSLIKSLGQIQEQNSPISVCSRWDWGLHIEVVERENVSTLQVSKSNICPSMFVENIPSIQWSILIRNSCFIVTENFRNGH